MGQRIAAFLKHAGLAACIVSLLLVSSGAAGWTAEPIKVGAVFSMTGWAGRMGTAEREGLEVMVERVNRAGGVLGRPIEVYYEDDQSNPTNSAIAATKLIRDKKVSCLIGATLTVFCMPMLPICENEHVPNISLGAGHDITVPFKKWVFRVPVTDDAVSPRMLKFTVETLGARRIALLHSTDSSGIMGAKGITDSIGNYNASIVITEKFETTDTNMIPQLTKVKSANPDAIILYTNGVAASVIAKNYQQLGMKTVVVGGQAILDPEFVRLSGKIVEDGRWIIFGLKDQYADRLPADDPWRVNIYEPFMKALKEKYGKAEYRNFLPNGHDALVILVEALKIAGTDDRAALRDALEKVKCQGLMGSYAYSATNHDGNAGESVEPLITRENKWWPYKK